MTTKLYVGNLPADATSEDLARLFAHSGKVRSASIVTDRESGDSKGFGFVEMSSRAEGDAAIRSVNGREMSGRTLLVNEARERSNGNRR